MQVGCGIGEKKYRHQERNIRLERRKEEGGGRELSMREGYFAERSESWALE